MFVYRCSNTLCSQAGKIWISQDVRPRYCSACGEAVTAVEIDGAARRLLDEYERMGRESDGSRQPGQG